MEREAGVRLRCIRARSRAWSAGGSALIRARLAQNCCAVPSNIRPQPSANTLIADEGDPVVRQVVGDVADGVAADVDHSRLPLAEADGVAVLHRAVDRRDLPASTSAGRRSCSPVAALIAALPPAWSGCQWVFQIWVICQPLCRRLAQVGVGIGRVDAGGFAAVRIVEQEAVVVDRQGN